MQPSPGNVYTQFYYFFLSYHKNWSCCCEQYVALWCPCITTLRGVLLHYCIPLNLLKCIMQICDRSLCISERDLGNARAAAELAMEVRAVERCHSPALESRVRRTRALGSAEQLKCAASNGLNSSWQRPEEGMLSKRQCLREYCDTRVNVEKESVLGIYR